MAEAIDLGPESLLGIAEGEDARTLRDRLDLALRYIANWYRATEDSDIRQVWWLKIDQVRARVEEAYASFTPADLFLGKDAVVRYNEAASAFPGLYRDLALSRDTLPEPDLIDAAAGFVDTIIETPGYLVHKIGKSLADGIGGAAGALVEKLWPYALLVGAGAGLYYFRAPILRALGRGAA